MFVVVITQPNQKIREHKVYEQIAESIEHALAIVDDFEIMNSYPYCDFQIYEIKKIKCDVKELRKIERLINDN